MSRVGVDAERQQELVDSWCCLVLGGRWDLGSSPEMTEGDQNMVAPSALTQEL